MSTLQKTFADLLRAKKRFIGVAGANVVKWGSGKASPTLETMERVCIANDIELPFFFDGRIESLIEYNKKVAAKMGLKVQIIFES
jgi:hypothetical protein